MRTKYSQYKFFSVHCPLSSVCSVSGNPEEVNGIVLMGGFLESYNARIMHKCDIDFPCRRKYADLSELRKAFFYSHPSLWRRYQTWRTLASTGEFPLSKNREPAGGFLRYKTACL